MAKRTEKEILADLVKAQEEYAKLHADPKNTTLKQVSDQGNKVKTFSKELDAYVSKGATDCQCGNHPMGMLKTPAYYDQARGVDVPAVWEVGCVYCPPYLVEREVGQKLKVDGKMKTVMRRSVGARATTPTEAVRKWNEGEWVEDTRFDRIPGFTPEFA